MVSEMADRAALVVKLLEQVRKLAEGAVGGSIDDPSGPTSQHTEGRAPKRPWEDTIDGNSNPPYDKAQSIAEKDMAIIRSKRATNTGAVNAGVPKGKYRKRSVSCLFCFIFLNLTYFPPLSSLFSLSLSLRDREY